MNFFFLFIFIFIALGNVMAQQPEDYYTPLPIEGLVATPFAVTPGERVVLAAGGNTYYTEKPGGLWHHGRFISLAVDFLGNDFNGVISINDSTLILYGDLSENSGILHGKHFIYRSTDNGRHWNKAVYDSTDYISSVKEIHPDGKGKLWMLVNKSNDYLNVSEDAGLHWQAYMIEKKFMPGYYGMHPSLDGRKILLLKNNFNSKLYFFYPESERPLRETNLPWKYEKKYQQIFSARFFEPYILIKTLDSLYYRRINEKKWKTLGTAETFEVSRDHKRLYVADKNFHIKVYDNRLRLLDKYSLKHWNQRRQGVLIQPANGNLYVFLTGDALFAGTDRPFFYKCSPGGRVTEYEMLTDEVPIPEPEIKVKFHGVTYGFRNKQVYAFDRRKKLWYRLTRLPYEVLSAAVRHDSIILTTSELKYYSWQPGSGKPVPWSLPARAYRADTLVPVSMSIVRKAQPLHHFIPDKHYYMRDGKMISAGRKRNVAPVMQRYMVNQVWRDSIQTAFLKHFIELLQTTNDSCRAARYFHPSRADIKQYRKELRKERRKRKKEGYHTTKWHFSYSHKQTDYDFYAQAVEHLDTLSPAVLDSALCRGFVNYLMDTFGYGVRVIIRFDDGSVLRVFPKTGKGFMDLPWLVDFNGLVYSTRAVPAARLLYGMTSGNIWEGGVCHTQTDMLFLVADYLYRRKMEKKNDE